MYDSVETSPRLAMTGNDSSVQSQEPTKSDLASLEVLGIWMKMIGKKKTCAKFKYGQIVNKFGTLLSILLLTLGIYKKLLHLELEVAILGPPALASGTRIHQRHNQTHAKHRTLQHQKPSGTPVSW